MALTKLTNMINSQVMADMISAKVEKKVRFMPYVKLDTTLQGQSGDTITISKDNKRCLSCYNIR